MFDQVSDYVDPIFGDLLCAFRKKYSCQSTWAIDDWKVSLDHNKMVGTLVCMDPVSKAFDCLPHGLIIAKLHMHMV